MSTFPHVDLRLLVATLVALTACGGVNSEETEFTDAAAQASDAAASDDAPLVDAGSDADPLGPPHQVFTSSISFGANFGGLVGADAECQTRADRGGLGGRWLAILIDANTALADRLVVRGPVMSRSGTLLAATPADFFAGNLLGPNLGTEGTGTHPDPTVAWIGNANFHCNNWTIESGQVSGSNTSVSGQSWTDLDANTSCLAQLPIQCIEQFE